MPDTPFNSQYAISRPSGADNPDCTTSFGTGYSFLIRVFCFFSLCALINIFHATGQVSLLAYDTLKVKMNGGAYYKNPWAGGLNSPQFSEIDLNGDGIKDLFVFERDVGGKNGSVLPFLNQGNPDSVAYKYMPEFESRFPEFHNWVALADYNCDGREDIFNWVSGGVTVYRNDYNTINGLIFTLASATGSPWSPALSTIGFTGPSNLYLSPFDRPAIADIDDDGDLDILCYCLGCSQVEFNRNYSVENFGVCDSLAYVIEDKCWGLFAEDLFNNSIDLGIACKTGKAGEGAYETQHPGGSSMLALDMDGDYDKELVISSIASNEMELLINGGDADNASMVAVAPNFPANSEKINISTFPAAYYLDVDNNGLKDLIAAPYTTGSVQNFESVWFYKNEGSAAAPVFNINRKNFLQGEMIDVGEGAYPVFFDYNEDGLPDLVVGNFGYWTPGGNYTGELALFANIGTPESPEFELATRDYQGLSALNLEGIYPAFGDLDNDGDKDLIIGDYEGNLHYLENTAGAGNVAAFVLSESNYKGIDVGQFATPQLVDVNRDGLLDLLIGERTGTIRYFENIGTAGTSHFVSIPTNDFFGGIDVMQGCCTGYNVPFLTELDSTGQYYLLVAGESGRIRLYGDIDGNLAGYFALSDSMIGGIDPGMRSSISGSDINNNGTLELAIGNYRGGVSVYSITGSPVIGVSKAARIPTSFKISPNPASGLLELGCTSGSSPIRDIVLMDARGRVIPLAVLINGAGAKLDVSGCKPGIYFVQVSQKGGSCFTGKVVLY